jgi:hypothetical protein
MIFPSEVTTPKYEATALKQAFLLAISNGFERVIFKRHHQTSAGCECFEE